MKQLALTLTLLLSFALLTGCSEEASTNTTVAKGPLTSAELDRFIHDLPSFPGLTTNGKRAEGEMPDPEELSRQIAAKADELGWDEERFMYVYSHAMSVLSMAQMEAMTERMHAMVETMPESQKAMFETRMTERMNAIRAEVDKEVPLAEQEIIVENLDKLYEAFGIRQP